MTHAEALAREAQDFDQMAAESLARSEECLRDHGCDDLECEALLASGLLDVDEMRLSNWELGKHHLPGEFALFIYQRTRIDPNWLYLGDPNRLPADIHARVIAAIVDEPELSSPKGNPRPSRRLRSIKPDDPE